MKRLLNSHYLLLVTVPTLLVAACFFLLFSRPVSADSGQTGVMKGYEAVLVRDGDTLSSLACSYASVKSHMSEKEYLEAVVSLNNISSSEYIRAGEYLLMPNFC